MGEFCQDLVVRLLRTQCFHYLHSWENLGVKQRFYRQHCVCDTLVIASRWLNKTTLLSLFSFKWSHSLTLFVLFTVPSFTWNSWWCGLWCFWLTLCWNSGLSTCGHSGSSSGVCMTPSGMRRCAVGCTWGRLYGISWSTWQSEASFSEARFQRPWKPGESLKPSSSLKLRGRYCL